ncbi:MAG TPA: phosphoglycerate dehydrogenase [Lachnospiraceae bacterium]|nr:phosphoglycerate dehydrogenase [Lachnospiraceae bacterium]
MKKFVSLFGDTTEIFKELNEQASAYAKEKGLEYVWVPQNPFNQEEVIRVLKDADAGLIDIQTYDDEIFSQIKERCRLLIRFGVGFDQVNLKDASKEGICVTRTTGANAQSVAEMALSQILACARQLEKNRRTVESGVWVKNVGVEISGKTVGIIGFGAIGKKLAGLLSGFACRILVYDPNITKETEEEYGVSGVSLDELYEKCDAISIHVPYIPATHHMINKDALSKMKKTAILVCTSRGNIVDEEALYEALKENRILGAGLDVYADEPLSPSNPLIGLDNVILTPHVSGQTWDALWGTYEKAIDIAADFFAGRKLSKADLLNPDYKNNI